MKKKLDCIRCGKSNSTELFFCDDCRANRDPLVEEFTTRQIIDKGKVHMIEKLF